MIYRTLIKMNFSIMKNKMKRILRQFPLLPFITLCLVFLFGYVLYGYHQDTKKFLVEHHTWSIDQLTQAYLFDLMIIASFYLVVLVLIQSVLIVSKKNYQLSLLPIRRFDLYLVRHSFVFTFIHVCFLPFVLILSVNYSNLLFDEWTTKLSFILVIFLGFLIVYQVVNFIFEFAKTLVLLLNKRFSLNEMLFFMIIYLLVFGLFMLLYFAFKSWANEWGLKLVKLLSNIGVTHLFYTLMMNIIIFLLIRVVMMIDYTFVNTESDWVLRSIRFTENQVLNDMKLNLITRLRDPSFYFVMIVFIGLLITQFVHESDQLITTIIYSFLTATILSHLSLNAYGKEWNVFEELRLIPVNKPRFLVIKYFTHWIMTIPFMVAYIVVIKSMVSTKVLRDLICLNLAMFSLSFFIGTLFPVTRQSFDLSNIVSSLLIVVSFFVNMMLIGYLSEHQLIMIYYIGTIVVFILGLVFSIVIDYFRTIKAY